MASGPITSQQIDGKQWKQRQTLFGGGGLQNHCRWWLQSWNSKTITAWKKVITNLDSLLKSRNITLPTKVQLSQSYGFSSSHVWMWELDCEQSWTPKNWCFWTVVLKETLESPLDCKELQPVNPKGNQSWIFIGRTDGKAETPIFCPPDVKNWLIWKDPDAGKAWRREEKGTTKNQMVGWHHQLNGHEFESTPGVSDAQGGLACCSPWGHKEWATEQLNRTVLTSVS